MFKVGDRVRLVKIVGEHTLPKWHDYVGQEAVVIQDQPNWSFGLNLTRIRFQDGEWFPAHTDEIEEIQ